MNVYIKTTESCNFNCIHCYNLSDKSELDFDKTKNFLVQLNQLCQSNVFIFHGGEPMIGDIDKMSSLMSDFQDIYWRISTNLGYELTEKRKEILLKMDQVRVSFDVGIRFGNISNLIKWYKNMRWLTRNRNDVYVNICLSTFLLRHEPLQLLKMLDKLGIKQYAFERITQTGSAQKHQYIIPSYQEIDRWLCKIYDLEINKQVRCRCQDILDIKLGIQNHPEQCYGKQCCRNSLTINSDGSIGNCPNDAKTDTIATTNDNAKYVIKQLYKKKHIPKKKCLTCKYYEYCHGGCEQQEWQNNICPYPKQLANLIMEK